MTPDELRAVLGDGTFRFRMGLTRGSGVGAYLARIAEPPATLAQRAAVFAANPTRTAVAPERPAPGAAATERALQCAERLVGESGRAAGRHPSRASERLPELSLALSADWMILDRSTARVVAYAMAFPSGFAPETLLGHNVERAHRPVPGIEQELGAGIARFLASLGPGAIYQRENLGICVGEALDRHPRVAPASPDEDTPLEDLTLRLEAQALVGLDEHSLLFVIGLRQAPLHALVAAAHAETTLAAWLETMPEAVAAYKGLDRVRTRLARELRGLPTAREPRAPGTM